MIFIKKNSEISTQKLVSLFIKRVKKSNLVARKRKTANYIKPISKLQEHRKAVRKAKYLEAQISGSKLAKRI